RALLDRFMAQLDGGPVILIGNSMGGAISVLQAADHPETVAGLVLVDPACPRASGAAVDRLVAATFAAYMIPRVGEQFIARRMRAVGPEGMVRQTLEMCCVDPTRVDPELVEVSIA